ncbi:MAG: hypothetical protein ACOCP8_06190 [archaeon]
MRFTIKNKILLVEVQDWLVGKLFKCRFIFPSKNMTLSGVKLSNKTVKMKIPDKIWERCKGNPFFVIGKVFIKKGDKEQIFSIYSKDMNLKMFKKRRSETYKMKALYEFLHNPDWSPSTKELKNRIGCSSSHARSILKEFRKGPIQIWDKKYKDSVLQYDGEYRGELDKRKSKHYSQDSDKVETAVHQLVSPVIKEEYNKNQRKRIKETLKEWRKDDDWLSEDKIYDKLNKIHNKAREEIERKYDDEILTMNEFLDMLNLSKEDFFLILNSLEKKFNLKISFSFYVFLLSKATFKEYEDLSGDNLEETAEMLLWELDKKEDDSNVEFLKEGYRQQLIKMFKNKVDLIKDEEYREKAVNNLLN